MFKRKAQSANKNVRRPGQALESSSYSNATAVDETAEKRHLTENADVDSGDDDDSTAINRPAKRQRQQNEHSAVTTKPAASPEDASVPAPSFNDPTLISVTSARSSQPDTSTNAHKHAHYAPKQPPTPTTDTPAAAATISLPSTNPAPSARFGPQRVSGYARNITRIDFQPDICKDWFECGSCGYGDSCKFLHDRLDYKSSYEVEKQWEESQKKKEAQRKDEEERRARGETVQREDSSGGKVGLPFACYICRKSFSEPVVTVCGHYFCERCALQRYVKTSRCAVCGKETQGSFSIARDLLKENAAASAMDGDVAESDDET